MSKSSEFDFVVYGATGFTGKLVVEYLQAKYSDNNEINWAMAGRSLEKLNQVKKDLDVSDSVLSKHLKVLEDANYIRLIKKTEFTRQRTWVSLTLKGRKSFKLHLRELKRIIG